MERNTQTMNAYIGIMNASDYGYATTYGRTTLDKYYGLNYTGSNWLLSQYNEWTLNAYNDNTISALVVFSSGNVDSDAVSLGYIVRPVVYLNPSVYVISGNGTEATPYQISY